MRMLALAALAVTLAGSSAAAQVTGGVVIGSGPVRGAVVFGGPVRVVRPYYGPEAYYVEPRVVVVEDWYGPRGNGYGWYRKHGYASRWMWWDGYRFYDREYARPGVRRVLVYERGGHYYRDPDAWWGGDRRWDRDDDRDRDRYRYRGRDRDDRRRRDDDRFRDRRWKGDDDRD